MISTTKNGKKLLAAGAVPTIFVAHEGHIATPSANSQDCALDSRSQNSEFVDCSNLNTRVADLEAQIFKMKLEHETELQSLQIRIREMKTKKTEMVADLRIMKKKLAEAEKKRSQGNSLFISETADIKNVSSSDISSPSQERI